ncbi:MAG: type II secretion system F family protein [Candidatus Aenigmarchaeota archaeon]|nr:type II secretion system F family protein [Candidatus Aenigmarchaeota archaeon]
MKKWQTILGISIIVSCILIGLGILSKDTGVLGNTILISTFIIFIPQVLVRYRERKEVKEIELRFPGFLRDLSENVRSGLSLASSIISVKRNDYGKLTKYVRKMASQLSWNIPLEKVLNNFAREINSKIIRRSLDIINETNRIGGDIPTTLDSLADSIMAFQDAEKEKASILNQYITIMYGISLVFIGIVVGIIKFLVPILQTSFGTGETAMFSNPCSTCIGFSCNICELYNIIGVTIFFLEPYSTASYYVSLLFLVSITEAFFAGVIAGQISEGSIIAGFKHSLFLVGIIFGIFSILVRIGVLGV